MMRYEYLVKMCLTSPRPQPFQLGVDDSADPYMLDLMESLVSRMNMRTISVPEFIDMLHDAVQVDTRTVLGRDIQRALLAGAAERLQFYYIHHEPQPDPTITAQAHWTVVCSRFFDRLYDAFAIIRKKAVAIYLK